jgi:hypothetical protein
LNLSAAIGVDALVSQIKRVSFMALNRQDTDQVEFVHLTDNKGVSQIGTTFRSAPDIRVAADWTPQTFGEVSMSAFPCGESTPPECSGVSYTMDRERLHGGRPDRRVRRAVPP